MLVPGPRSVPTQGGVSATPDRDARRACDAKHRARVDHDLRELDVARYARDCGDLQVRVRYRVEQCQRVVDAVSTSISTRVTTFATLPHRSGADVSQPAPRQGGRTEPNRLIDPPAASRAPGLSFSH